MPRQGMKTGTCSAVLPKGTASSSRPATHTQKWRSPTTESPTAPGSLPSGASMHWATEARDRRRGPHPRRGRPHPQGPALPICTTTALNDTFEYMGDTIGDVQESGQRVEIRLPVRHNPKLQKVIERVNADEELYALWTVMNVNAVTRLSMTDHGPIHFQIVSNIALKMLRQLLERGVVPNIV